MQAQMDPTLMSVRQLRSVMSEYGVDVPSGATRKSELVMLFLEEGVAAKAQAREKKDQALMKKKRKSSSIPWADVNVVPKKAQRKSVGQAEPRESKRERKATRQSTGAMRKTPVLERRKKRVISYAESESESESESERDSESEIESEIESESDGEDTVMSEADAAPEVIDLSLSPSPPPVIKRKARASRAKVEKVEERESEGEKKRKRGTKLKEREREREEKERMKAEKQEKERERNVREQKKRLRTEKELMRMQERELSSLKRAQELERKRIERRQSEEIAKITAKRKVLEKQKQKLQAALSERNVSSSVSLAVPTAPVVKRRATASPRPQTRATLLPRLTPENTRRRVEERENFSVSPVISPMSNSPSSPQWPSAPLSPPDHRDSFEEYEGESEEEGNEEGEFVYREEDEEGLSLEALVATVAALLLLSVAAFLFLNFRPLALPYCSADQSENCVPCPRHGTCAGQEVTCEGGFVKQWAGGKWHCVEDMETKRIAHAVLTSEFERRLRQRKGERDCSQLARPVMLEHEAKIELEEMYKARVGSKKAAASFVDFYREIERLVTLDPELPVSRESGSAGYYFTTSSAPLRPLGCSVRLFVIENSLYIAIVAFVAAVVAFKLWQLTAVGHTKEIVLEELREARAQHDSGLSIVHLRDTVAPPSLLKSFVWSGVCASIEADSRVGRTLQLLNGEHQDMWEWEAPL